jgi:hypothetical protein
MNKDIKVKDNKQKPKDACPAETDADSDLQPKITTSSPAFRFVFQYLYKYTTIITTFLFCYFFLCELVGKCG